MFSFVTGHYPCWILYPHSGWRLLKSPSKTVGRGSNGIEFEPSHLSLGGLYTLTLWCPPTGTASQCNVDVTWVASVMSVQTYIARRAWGGGHNAQGQNLLCWDDWLCEHWHAFAAEKDDVDFLSVCSGADDTALCGRRALHLELHFIFLILAYFCYCVSCIAMFAFDSID